MTRPTLLVLRADPLPRLGRLAGRTTVRYADEHSLADQLPSADVLLVWDIGTDAVRRAWPAGGPRPAWVHTASTAVDRLLGPGLIASDTVVTRARGIFEESVAEYVAGLVLVMAKDFPETREPQRRGHRQRREGLRVAGSRATVVGAGPVGRAITATLRALGLVVAVTGRTARPGVHGPDSLVRLLTRSDWVVCAAPLTEGNQGMFDTRMFGLMQPSTRFINVGSDRLVVEDDLVAAVSKRWIAGAALDMPAVGPLDPESPLWNVPGLILSPHPSGLTVGWRDRLGAQFVTLYERWAAGKPLLHVVDKERARPPA